MDKTQFYIFDYMGNFAFFAQNPKSIESTGTVSLAEKAFGLKVRILQELQNAVYQAEELSALRAEIAARLERKMSPSPVKAQAAMLAEIRTPAFWTRATLPQIDRIRRDLRGLMQYLHEDIRTREINISDEIISAEVGMRLTKSTALDCYRERANRYVHEHEHHPLLTKLRNNIPLSAAEWEEMERIFWEEVGSAAEYVEMLRRKQTTDAARPPQDTLGTFVRSLTGLSEEAARAAFSEFLDTALYNEEQIALIHNIMEWVMKNGTMDVAELGKPINFGGAKIWEVFQGLEHTEKIRSILERIKKNAAWAAA